MVPDIETPPSSPEPDRRNPETLPKRMRRLLIGAPRDLRDRSIFHRLALIPLLAWVGLGADGLSSSAYGPEEAFHALAEHKHLALVLALATAATVAILSASYSYIIEDFPSGGGGYSVASKLLGPRVGVVSGCALLIDYVLTITVSISAAGDALFSLVPHAAMQWKLVLEIAFILGLTLLNLRGVRESILAMLPIFAVFVITHIVLISAGIGSGLADFHAAGRSLPQEFNGTHESLGLAGTLALIAFAYSLGGGTYTGIEAVSNGVSMMREPRVAMARRTMIYLSISLGVTAAGLLVCYFLKGVEFTPGKTLNAVLAADVGARMGLGEWFVILTLLSEGALLVVAAQAGFLDGPRILANMAVDSWVPRRFASLSERLTTQNGILLVGGAALAALLYTHGNVQMLVVMYSVNVFVTFTLSMFAMLRHWWSQTRRPKRKRHVLLFAVSFVMCATILAVTVYEKFLGGAWVTILVTGSAVALCFVIHRHYARVSRALIELDSVLDQPRAATGVKPLPLDPTKSTAVVFVGGYSGVGVHTFLSVVRSFPDHYHNYIFASIGVVDSGVFKGADEIEALKHKTESDVDKFVEFARANGLRAEARAAVGTEVAGAAETLCSEIAAQFPRVVFFGSRVIHRRETWAWRMLHNETAVALQRRLHERGQTMVILPVMVR